MSTKQAKQRVKWFLHNGIFITCAALIWALSACGSGPGGAGAGDPVSRGERIFAARCAHCHATNAEPGIGPGLGGIFTTLPNGVDYAGNLPNGAPITDANVAAWIREGGQGEIGRMPPIRLNDQEMTDLLTYLKTLAD